MDLFVVSKSQVLEEAGRLFASHEGCDAAQVAESLLARERMGSTALGNGFAIPHARLKGLRQAAAAYLHLKFAVPFDAPDGKPVSEVLVVLVPEQAAQDHLQLLAQAAEMFQDRQFREHLRDQGDAAGVYSAFVDWPAIAK